MLAEALGSRAPDQSDSLVVPIKRKGGRAPLFLVPPAASTSMRFVNFIRELGPEQPVYGLDPAGLYDERKPHETIEEMAAYYVKEIRKVQPRGPYVLGGICFGASVAYEMALQLREQGEEIALLVVLDNMPPRTRSKAVHYSGYYLTRLLQRFRKGTLSEAVRRRIVGSSRWLDELDPRTQLVLQKHTIAHGQYRAGIYDGPIVVFESEANAGDILAMWKKTLDVDIDHCVVPGSSHTGIFFEEKCYTFLARELDRRLSASGPS
jgi:hypothetical protein